MARGPVLLARLVCTLSLAAALTGFKQAATVSGQITAGTGGPVAGARVTLFTTTLSYFQETRSDAGGNYQFGGVPSGTYRLGVAARGYQYQEVSITLSGTSQTRSFALSSETQTGRWDIVGVSPEPLGGTNGGMLLADGRLMFCHDTIDPIALNPATGVFSRLPSSGKLQGCFMPNVLPDGRVIFVGGTNTPVYGPGTTDVKTFNPANNQWLTLPSLNEGRWYPTVAQLPDGDLLSIGGGGLDNPVRLKTCELMDATTKTWSAVGDVAIANEQSPIALLYTGEVLMTHRPPQLYNPATKLWRAAADFVQGNRMSNGDHSDHEIVVMPDGKVVAVGYRSFNPSAPGVIVEIYDPIANAWRLGTNFSPVRSRAGIVLLPDKKVLVIGGEKEESGDPTPTNPWNQVALTDLYNPAADSWRRLAPLNIAREYHQMPFLVPDGRVITLGGEGQPGNEPAQSTAEAFTPPYLMRGVRPQISGMSSSNIPRGGSVTFTVAYTAAPTSVILVGVSANSHFSDSGNARFLELSFTQTGQQITAQVPANPVRTPLGQYMLFAMVDDIPSVAQIVTVSKSQDSDGDGLPDAWETQYFGSLNQAAGGDPDSDALTNAQEYAAGTNPTNADTDGDGMADGWELQFGLNPLNPGDASADSDGDGFTNLQEFQAGSDPSNTASTPSPGGGGSSGNSCGTSGVEALMFAGLLACLRRRRKWGGVGAR